MDFRHVMKPKMSRETACSGRVCNAHILYVLAQPVETTGKVMQLLNVEREVCRYNSGLLHVQTSLK